MNEIDSINKFVEYLQSIGGCINCKYLQTDDMPIEQKKCTFLEALNPSKDYPNGVEHEKEWIRQDDIKLGMNKGRDANLYFMCFYFKGKE